MAHKRDVKQLSKFGETLLYDERFFTDESKLHFFKLFIDTLPFLLMVTDTSKEYRIMLVNERMAKSLGKSGAELIGNSVLQYFPPDVGEKRRKYAERAVKTKTPSMFVDERGGRFFTNEYYPLEDEKGNVQFGVIIVRDITQEKKAEKQRLAKQGLYYESLIEHSMDLITMIDAKGKILYESPSLQDILGYSPKERFHESVFENIHPKDIHCIKEYFNNILSRPGLTNKVSYRIKHKNGSYRFFESIANNQIHNKQLKGLIINTRDVTEREQTRMELTKHRNYLENLVNSVSQMIFMVNREYVFTLWNTSAERITGFKKNRIVGKQVKRLDLFENTDEVVELLQHMFSGKNGFPFRVVVKTVFGSKRLLMVSPSVVRKNEGIVTDVVFVCEDITFKDVAHGKLIPGTSYMMTDPVEEKTLDVFKELLQSDHTGLFITRSQTDAFADVADIENMKVVYLSSTRKKHIETVSHIEDILKLVQDFFENTVNPVLCMNRVDYLCARSSFEEVMGMLYKLNDLTQQHKALFLLRINKLLFSEEQVEILKEEFSPLPYQHGEKIFLNEDLYNILQYIATQNEKNSLVSHTKLSHMFSISRVTTQKRIEELVEQNLVLSKKQGRSKFLFITDAGRELLRKRDAL
jgi:PAS domain S-box-containing protein